MKFHSIKIKYESEFITFPVSDCPSSTSATAKLFSFRHSLRLNKQFKPKLNRKCLRFKLFETKQPGFFFRCYAAIEVEWNDTFLMCTSRLIITTWLYINWHFALGLATSPCLLTSFLESVCSAFNSIFCFVFIHSLHHCQRHQHHHLHYIITATVTCRYYYYCYYYQAEKVQ